MNVDLISKYKDGFTEHMDLRFQEKIKCRVRIENGKLVQNDYDTSSGISSRVYKNGIYGFSSSSDIADTSIKNVINEARQNANILGNYIKGKKDRLPQINNGYYAHCYKMKPIDRKYLLNLAWEVNQYIKKTYTKLASYTVIVNTDLIEKFQVTSNGFDANTLMLRSHVTVMMVAKDKAGNPVVLDDYYGTRGYADEVFVEREWLYKKLDKMYTEVMLKSEGVYTEAGYKDIILCSDLAGMLAHEAVGHTCEADMVMAGGVASFNMGKSVASDKVTLIDYAHTAFGKEVPIPIYVDDEGTLGKDAVIIENGVLKSYMHDRRSADILNYEPTGNARAYDYCDEPLIRMRNTVILPGEDKIEDMISAIDDGYILSYPANGQADSTGEFMFGAGFGMEIKNGKLARPIRGATLSGFAFELLKTVDMVSEELNWRSGGMCGKKTGIQTAMGGPAIKCKANIGGR